MKSYEVSFRPLAEADLLHLYDYIADEAGPAAAAGYINRIEAACLSLATFPERGTRRDDIRLGLRVFGVERRVTIVFQIVGSAVLIVRVLYGGQDYDRALQGGGSS